MLPLETLTIVLLSGLLGAGAVILFLTLRRGGSGASVHLDAGRFQSVLDATGSTTGLDRDESLATAVAAKHLLDLDAAREILEALLRDDKRDGEAWLELGLVATYDGRYEDARGAFDRVAESRSDLLESLTLHRAWLALKRGDTAEAESLFAEVEIPLETKLRVDMGEGDPAFSEWFLQAGTLWRQRGDDRLAEWAMTAARKAAPESRLIGDLAQ